MAIKDQALEILRRMESGVNDLYESMKKRMAASNARYDAAATAADTDYRKEKRRASGEARVRLSNDLERLADQGLASSGGAMQTRLAHNAALSDTLSALAGNASAKKQEAALEKARAGAEIEAETEKTAANLRSSLMKTYLDQLNADRANELAAQKNAAELRLKERSLALQEEKAKRSSAQSVARASLAGVTAASAESGGLTPSRSPYQVLKEIVEQYTAADPDDRRYKIVNHTKISKALKAIVEDPGISAEYRRELYLYARSLGYAT